MATHEELSKYLLEHIVYEWLMLRFTYGRRTVKTQLLWNALFESFSLHARGLYDFLRNDRDNRNFIASDFVPGFAAADRKALEGLMDKMNQQVMHLGKRRASDAGKKINGADVEKINCWIEANMQRFISELPNNFANLWDPVRVDPAQCDGAVLVLSTTSMASSQPMSDSTAMHWTLESSELKRRK